MNRFRLREWLAAGLSLVFLATCGLLAAEATAQSRGFELVTPPGADFYDAAHIPNSGFDLFQGIEPDGSRVYWATTGDFPGLPVHGSSRNLLMESSRGSTSWGTSWMAPFCAGVPNLNLPGAKCSGEITAQNDDVTAVGVSEGNVVLISTMPPNHPFAIDIDPMDRNRATDLYLCGASNGCSLISAKTTGGTDVGALGITAQHLISPAVSRDLGTSMWATTASLDPIKDSGWIDFYASYRGETVLELDFRLHNYNHNTPIKAKLNTGLQL